MAIVVGRQTRWWRAAAHLAVWLTLAISLYPFASIIWLAIAAPSEGGTGFRLTADHFRIVLGLARELDDPGRRMAERIEFWRWMENSLIVAIGTAAIATLLALSTGYAFARLRFAAQGPLDKLLYMSNFFPGLLLAVAYWGLFDRIGEVLPIIGLDSLGGLVLALVGTSTLGMVWAFKGYFQQLPHEVEDAARIDGANDWQVFTRVALPLARPMIAMMVVLTITTLMYEPVLSSTLLTSSETATLPLGLARFITAAGSAGRGTAVALHEFAAAALLAAIPGVVACLVAQRWMDGSLDGAVKG